MLTVAHAVWYVAGVARGRPERRALTRSLRDLTRFAKWARLGGGVSSPGYSYLVPTFVLRWVDDSKMLAICARSMPRTIHEGRPRRLPSGEDLDGEFWEVSVARFSKAQQKNSKICVNSHCVGVKLVVLFHENLDEAVRVA